MMQSVAFKQRSFFLLNPLCEHVIYVTLFFNCVTNQTCYLPIFE